MASAGSVLLCALLLSAPGPAEDSVDLPLGWEVGQRLQYEIVKSGQRTRDGKVTFKATTRTDLEIEVLRADADGYLVAWTQRETRFDDPRFRQEAVRILPPLLSQRKPTPQALPIQRSTSCQTSCCAPVYGAPTHAADLRTATVRAVPDVNKQDKQTDMCPYRQARTESGRHEHPGRMVQTSAPMKKHRDGLRRACNDRRGAT